VWRRRVGFFLAKPFPLMSLKAIAREVLAAEDLEMILVVEDDSSVRQMMERLIGRLFLDQQIVAVAGAVEALALLGHQPITLALVDYFMPGIDGLRLTQAIKAASPSTRVVVISAVVAPDLSQRAGTAGADVFLAKPFTFEELQAVVTGLW
jgi:CheY-like chemotaxis protein